MSRHWPGWALILMLPAAIAPRVLMANEIVNSFLLVYAGLFPIVNPIGCAPIFLGMTQFSTETQRRVLARGVAINSFFLLFGALFVGSYILEFFGIDLAVMRIAGGLVVTAFAWRLLNADLRPSHQDAETAHGEVETVDAFYPLSMPLTVGPGAISVAITLGSQRPKVVGLAQLAILGSTAIVSLMAMALTIYLVYSSADAITARLGKAGTAVVTRLSAFIMLCIGIQIVWNGWAHLPHGG